MNPYPTPRRRRPTPWLAGLAALAALLAFLGRSPDGSQAPHPPASVAPASVAPASVAPASVAPSTPSPVAKSTTRTDRNAFFAQLARRAQSPEPLPPSDGRPPANPIVQETRVVLDRSLLEFLSLPAEERAAHPFRLPTPDGREHLVEPLRTEVMGDQEGGLSGTIAGVPGSHVFLGYAQEAVAGSWFVPGEGLYQIRYAGDGTHRVRELDPSRFLPEAMPYAPPEGAAAAAPANPLPVDPAPAPTSEPALAAIADAPGTLESGMDPLSEAIPLAQAPTAADAPAIAADVSTVIDVMVVYTAACKTANGGDSGISALINASITSANTAYSNSGAAQSVRRIHSAEVSYTASGALATDLPRLTNTSDGHMDNVHTLRNTYKADLVCLLVSVGSDAAGIAYLWSPSAGNAAYGFSVVMDVYAEANLTFAHELGHNMGCGHASGDGGSGAYSYSYGHRFTVSGSTYRTVMAYAPGTRIPYFSNPSVSYLGTATGHSTANNTRTLGDSRASIAAYRSGTTQWQEWSVYASGDLNADSKPDLIWRSSISGRVIAWLMDGTTQSSTASLWTPASASDMLWVPVATGDFNADSKTDIIWRNTSTGRAIVWIMDGTTRTSTVTIWAATNPGDSLWVPITTGDLNADSKTDIIWRNSSTGRVIVWFMNGTTRTSSANLWVPATTSDTLWVPVTTGDFNADSKTDILWRNSSTGRGIVWMMNGTTRTSTTTVWAASGPTDSLWVPAVAGDFDASGAPDLIWRNSSTGRVIAWLLSGTTTSSTAIIWSP